MGGRRNGECKTGGEGRTKESICSPVFISFICGNMWTQQNGAKSRRGEADEPSDARGHKRGNTVCWVWNQNNNSVSAVQMRPCCSVPACYWFFECLCVAANLDQSGTGGHSFSQHCSLSSNIDVWPIMYTLTSVGQGSVFSVDADRDDCLSTLVLYVSLCFCGPDLKQCVMYAHCPLPLPLFLGLLLLQR